MNFSEGFWGKSIFLMEENFKVLRQRRRYVCGLTLFQRNWVARQSTNIYSNQLQELTFRRNTAM